MNRERCHSKDVKIVCSSTFILLMKKLHNTPKQNDISAKFLAFES